MLAIYLRVSTDEKSTGQTVQSQLFSIERYAKDQNIVIDKIFKDEGWSGALLARPGLDDLREAVRQGEITKLLVYHPDRLARAQHLQFLLLDEFEKAKIEIVFTALPDFFSGNKETLIVNKSIYSMIAELERARITERFRLGKLRKVSQGQVVTSRAPYGFDYDRNKKVFTHNPKEIGIAKMILNWGKEGRSDHQIIRMLKERGIKTRTGKNFWAKSTISKILGTNLSVYSGFWFYNKYKMVVPKKRVKMGRYQRHESSRMLNNKTEWIKVPLDPGLAIITEADVSLIRRNRKANMAVKKGNIKHDYLLQGKIYCDNCKGLNYADCFHNIEYYRCATKKRNFPNPTTCPGGSIKAEALEKAIWNKLLKFVTDKDLVKTEVNKYIERNKSDKVVTNYEEINLIKRNTELQKEREKLVEAFSKSLITENDLALQKKRIEEETSLLDGQLNELSGQRNKTRTLDVESLNENIDGLCAEVRDVMSSMDFEEKKKALELLGIKVFYFKGHYAMSGSLALRSSKPHHVNL